MYSEDYLEKMLAEEYRVINRHAPYVRKSLRALLRERVPIIILRDGTRHMVRREELRLLASMLEEDKWDSLMIPIILEVNPRYGEGAVVVRDPVASLVIARLLGIKEYSVPLILFRPQLIELREKLRTTTTVLFMPG